MRIMQVSTADIRGGAERVAWNLFQAYRKRGLCSWLVVGYKTGDDKDVVLMPNDVFRGQWARICISVANLLSPIAGKIRGANRLRRLIQWTSEPDRFWKTKRGQEDYDFPGTWHLLELRPELPDIVHCHNLHGGYFDLRALSWLSHQVPTILTLHDAWLLSGHCAHPFDCERWKTGCEFCPDLAIYPAIKRNAAAYNLQRKRRICARSRLYVATPCHWLMRMVEQSMLAQSIVEARVIANGVDLTVFHPAERHKARDVLGIRQDARVLLFVGNATRSNRWRDYRSLEAAVRLVSNKLQNERLLLICVGEKGKTERIGSAEAWFIGYQGDPAMIARYYHAADIYVHPAIVDTFPNTVLEALACGIPVVTTAVGGIPEQVKGLCIDDSSTQLVDLNRYGNEKATGVFTPPRNAQGMATAIETLLKSDTLRLQLGENASQDARQRFDLERQVNTYLEWYQKITERT
jgi:glycosyltransferase involved in cell wall biosynthesis